MHLSHLRNIRFNKDILHPSPLLKCR
uniref:Uncharacterized protein n=1 Tax=Anguilla anguilla TaxID=7936 RepID=A0A0E9Y0G9_ANGAN